MINTLFLGGWYLLTFFGVSNRIRKQNEEYNRQLLAEKPLPPASFIENQAELNALRFGRDYTVGYGGCGLIALYNVFIALGITVGEKNGGHTSASDLFLTLENRLQRRGVALWGKFGIHPAFLRRLLIEEGLVVRRIKPAKAMDESLSREDCANTDETYLVTAFTGKRFGSVLHTVCITHAEDGFRVHNGYRREAAPTLAEAIRGISCAGATPVYLIGIQK